MNTKEQNFDIMGGPSKDTLFDACKYAYSKTTKMIIEFDVASGYTQPPESKNCAYVKMQMADIKIAGIEHEDGSGDSFNLRGYCRANINPFGEVVSGRPYEFRAYYNTKTRKGHISFTQ